jgi:hypothetical protein
MKRTTLVRVGSFALLCAAATLSLSLTAPIEPKGAQTDSDPQNPSNWEFRTLDHEGDDNAHRYEYKSGGGYELATYYRDWDVMQWYRNGIAVGPPYGAGPDLPIPLPTVVGEAPSVDWSSQGTVTMVIEWIGQGAPPSSVRLQVTGPIEILVATGGDADGDDGFGSDLESEAWTGGTRYFIDDPVVETYAVDPNSGHCEIEVEKSAIAQSYSSNGYAFSDAKYLYVAVDPDPKPLASAPVPKMLAGLFGQRYLASIFDFVRR